VESDLVTPDQIKAWIDGLAHHLEFAHRTPTWVFVVAQTLLDNITPEGIDALVALSQNHFTRQELSDEIARARDELPAMKGFLQSDESLVMAQKLRDLENRQILIDVIARFFG
jgi:hypothetical protein